jgi:hypothetical protein
MSESLRASIEKLKQASSEMNRAADEAARVVKQTEAFLNKECSFGIEAHVLVREESVECEEGGYYHRTATVRTTLSYERFADDFRITVSRGDGSPDDTIVKPWSEWDRQTKLEAVKFLPNLIESLVNSINSPIQEAVEATSQVAAALGIEKGGKK